MAQSAPGSLTIDFHEQPRLPRGFSCASKHIGLKESAPDLALFASAVDAQAAAVFTRNQFPGASVIIGRERIKQGRLRAIVVNSKISNVGTGQEGMRRAERMAAAAGKELGVPAEMVLMSSTGIIGLQIPIDRIEAGLVGMAAQLQDDPLVGVLGMMTTDTHPKAVSLGVGDAVITLVAKGAGMIEPNMATMLVYVFTDAAFPSATLHRLLTSAVHVSLNMLSIDTDTSTSDTCAILANGLAGPVPEADFGAALTAGCIRMTEMLARDGEGASKLLRVTVRGAKSEAEARQVAKSAVNSPLIKTMAYGADPNIGRVLMAVGKCFDCTVEPERLVITINGTPVFADELRVEFDEPALRAELAGDPVDIGIDLGVGDGTAVAYGCDLTEGYIHENAAYYST